MKRTAHILLLTLSFLSTGVRADGSSTHNGSPGKGQMVFNAPLNKNPGQGQGKGQGQGQIQNQMLQRRDGAMYKPNPTTQELAKAGDTVTKQIQATTDKAIQGEIEGTKAFNASLAGLAIAPPSDESMKKEAEQIGAITANTAGTVSQDVNGGAIVAAKGALNQTEVNEFKVVAKGETANDPPHVRIPPTDTGTLSNAQLIQGVQTTHGTNSVVGSALAPTGGASSPGTAIQQPAPNPRSLIYNLPANTPF